MLLMFWYMLGLATAAPAMPSLVSPLASAVDNAVPIIPALLSSVVKSDIPLGDFIKTAAVGDTLVSGEKSYTLVNKTANAGSKRQDGCYSYTYLQTNVDRTGLWWQLAQGHRMPVVWQQ